MPKKSRRYTTPVYNFIPDDIVSYNTINVLKVLCSADDILDRMRYDSNIIFKNLRNEIFDISNVLPVDEECLCDMGWGTRPYVNKYYCIACELMRRLSSSVKIPSNKIIDINVGKYKGNKIRIIKETDNFNLYTNDNNNQEIYDILIQKQINLELIEKSYIELLSKSKLYTTTSHTANYITTCIFITNKMMKYKMPNFPSYIWSFYCNKNVHIIENTTHSFNDIINNDSFQKTNKVATAHTNLNPLKLSVVKSILLQLVSSLHFLSKYAFTHGVPNVSSIKFTMKSINYKYDNISISSPFILHIQPSYYSSFTFESDKGNNFRMGYCKNIVDDNIVLPISNRELIVNYYKSNKISGTEIFIHPDIIENLSFCFKIGQENIEAFRKLTNDVCIPILTSSFEFYCFMISLMCEDSFYVTFIEDVQMQRLWYNLWFSTEYSKMMEDLQQLKLKINVEHKDIVNMVSNYTLRVDALRYFWDHIKLD
jgi:hypothetical protein